MMCIPYHISPNVLARFRYEASLKLFTLNSLLTTSFTFLLTNSIINMTNTK